MPDASAPGMPWPGEDPGSPLSVAISRRDREAMQLVQRAVDDNKVILAFQPVVRPGSPERALFHEGLVRVLDHTGRIIPAASFLGVVEERELGRQLDTQALELGLAALAEEPSLRLSINMSARSIGYPKWLQTLRRGLAADPTAGHRLILEISEHTANAMPDLVQVFMAEMQAQGIAFALDHFGAGQTVFRYLRDFYFDILKIDGAFTKDIASNPDNQLIAAAMLSLAQNFDMVTVAGDVESRIDAEFLSRAGCNLLQGYYFGAPTVRPWWRQRRARRSA